MPLETRLDEFQPDSRHDHAEREELAAYVNRYHEADKRASIFEEKLRSHRGLDVMFATGIGIGGVILGVAPSLWDGTFKGPVALAVGAVLTIGSVIARSLQK